MTSAVIDRTMPLYYPSTFEEKVANFERCIDAIQRQRQVFEMSYKTKIKSYHLEIGTRQSFSLLLMQKCDYKKAENQINKALVLAESIKDSSDAVKGAPEQLRDLLKRINHLKNQVLIQGAEIERHSLSYNVIEH